MSRKRRTHSPVADLNRQLRRPDLSILGAAVSALPPAQWEERMFFAGVPDTDLRARTDDRFPATLRQDHDTHPLFVLHSNIATGHLVCPCTSRKQPARTRYIRKGCRLEMSDHQMDRDSFLLEQFAFTLPLDSRFSRRLYFKGRVPDSCLAGGRP